MKKLYQVQLNEAEKNQLHKLLRKGEANTRVLTRARILLKAASGCNDARIAEALEISKRTVLRIRQRFVEGGVALALYERERSGAPAKFDAAQQAMIIATACSPAPTGYQRWTLRLLSERLVEMGVVEQIAPNSVRSILKKTNCSRIGWNIGSYPTK